MSKSDEILPLLGQIEALVLKVRAVIGSPAKAPVAAPAPRRATPAAPPVSRPSPAVQKVQAAFQAGAENPAWPAHPPKDHVVTYSPPLSVAHKDGALPLLKAKITQAPDSLPSSNAAGDPYFKHRSANEPAWVKAMVEKAKKMTWAEILADACARVDGGGDWTSKFECPLGHMLGDTFKSVVTYEGNKYVAKWRQQAQILADLVTGYAEANPPVGPAGDVDEPGADVDEFATPTEDGIPF